jgi:hypothetical protein
LLKRGDNRGGCHPICETRIIPTTPRFLQVLQV